MGTPCGRETRCGQRRVVRVQTYRGDHLGSGAMRMSDLFLPTEREAPADAEALSHIWGVRAGLVRQLGAGLWTWLPAGWRVHQRVVQIIREEMDAIGGQEMLMPVIHPRELWKRTGRDEIDEVFKLERPPRRRTRPGDHARGVGDVPRRCGRALISRPAVHPLPLPDQGPRRAAPARRSAAHARVHHEGLLLVRP